MSARFTATYLIETAHPLQEAAEIMAGEQSAGTFVRVPGESDALREGYGARVEHLEPLDEVPVPSLPGSRPPEGEASPHYRQAEVVLSFPFDTIGTSLTGLLTAVSGNLFELSPFSGLKLRALTLPSTFTDAQPGPGFGVDGTRELTGVRERPLVGTIIKPSVGLSPEETATLVSELCEAGLDFIKDDELQSDSPHSPFAERVRAVTRVVNEHADKTGKKVMVAFNLTGDVDEMLRRHDLVLGHGGGCVMVNVLAVGLAALETLRKHAALPIHAHRAGWGMLSRHPLLGMEYPVYAALCRLAGADHLHVNGLRNKFCETDGSVIASARACSAPLGNAAPALPVFSSGQWAGHAPDTYAALGSADLLHLAGGGILAHPDGAAAGVRSMQEAWAAALAGTPLDDYARTHPALKGALGRFGP